MYISSHTVNSVRFWFFAFGHELDVVRDMLSMGLGASGYLELWQVGTITNGEHIFYSFNLEKLIHLKSTIFVCFANCVRRRNYTLMSRGERNTYFEVM